MLSRTCNTSSPVGSVAATCTFFATNTHATSPSVAYPKAAAPRTTSRAYPLARRASHASSTLPKTSTPETLPTSKRPVAPHTRTTRASFETLEREITTKSPPTSLSSTTHSPRRGADDDADIPDASVTRSGGDAPSRSISHAALD